MRRSESESRGREEKVKTVKLVLKLFESHWMEIESFFLMW
jgi:hypothetical protein